jgi:raffinose/stachyose/melibiose transport system substrate-binding protein
MTISRHLPWFGFVLLAVAFLLASGRVLLRPAARAERDDSLRIVRIAHWQLENGLRETLDELAAEFMARHPDVRVEQLAIPERLYPAWLRTQIVGGTAPDLIQLGKGGDLALYARAFEPLTPWVEQANPFNAGTPFADTAWRDTFVDGLAGTGTYNAYLGEYLAVPLATFSYRVFYNRALWRTAFGDLPPPTDLEEFLALGERMREWGSSRGVVALAGSRDYSARLLDVFTRQQTQGLAPLVDSTRTVQAGGVQSAISFLRGEWSLETPAVSRALELGGVLGRLYQPGFREASREDAILRFTQGRAFMIATGSWDYPSLRGESSFEIGVFPVPLPHPGRGRFGELVSGPLSESQGGAMSFALNRSSKNPESAVQFLRYLTSREGATRFAARSGWVPATLDVPLPSELGAFRLRPDGLPAGPTPTLSDFSPDADRVLRQNAHRLDRRGGAEALQDFIVAAWPDYERAVITGARRHLTRSAQNSRQKDLFAAAQFALGETAKAHRLLESQHLDDLAALDLREALESRVKTP